MYKKKETSEKRKVEKMEDVSTFKYT